MPQISVIIPCYKVESYLGQCVDSVLNQSFADFELILVDDGSPDRCGEICDAYAEKDNRVVVIHQPNKGLAAARNAGTKRAVGTYIIFMDSDDYWLANDFLDRLYIEIESNQVDMVIFQLTKLKLDGTLSPPRKLLYVEQVNTLPVSRAICSLIQNALFTISPVSRIFRHNIIRENNILFDEDMITSEDIEWGIMLFLHIGKMRAIDYPMYAYRIRKDSICGLGLRDQTSWERRYRIIKKWLPQFTEQVADQELAHSFLGFLAWQYAIMLGSIAYIEDMKQQKSAYEKARELKPLIRYRVNWKTWGSWVLVNFTGLRFSSRVFDWYINAKRR